MSKEVQEAVAQVMESFNLFKEENNKRLAAIEKGNATGDLTAKVEAISNTLDRFENMNAKLTQAEEAQKAVQAHLERLEAAVNRPGTVTGVTDSKAEASKLLQVCDSLMRCRPEHRDREQMDFVKNHPIMAAIIKGDDKSAGFLMAPPEIEAGIMTDVIEMTPIRQLATVRVIGVSSFKWRKRTGTVTAMRAGEVQPRQMSEDPTYGMGEIHTPEMTAKHEVSVQAIEDSAFDLFGELRDQVAEQMAAKEGIEGVLGGGNAVNQMEGFLVASGVGESVTGDAAKITADGMIDCYYGLKTVYARNGRWALNRLSLRDIRKLKDTTGQYLWVPGIATATPNTILGQPYIELPDMPNVAGGAYPVAFGDFKKAYLVIDRVGLGFMVDYISEADNGMVVYRARKRVGGGVYRAEAIRKLKVSA